MMTMIAVFDFKNNKVSYKTYHGDCSRDIEKAVDLEDGHMESREDITFEEFNKIIKREIVREPDFEVTCDETNNSEEDRAQRKLNVDVEIYNHPILKKMMESGNV